MNQIFLRLFFLYFVLMSGECSEIMNCNLQRFINHNNWTKHLMIFMSIYMFTFILDWFPLKNGYLPAKAKIGDTLVTLMEGKKIKWDKFPKNTPIGYITPMILWDKLDKLPNVYQLNLE